MTIFNPNQVPEVDAVDAQSGAGDHILLDVRELDEWEAGHAPGARWIPLGELERARVEIPFNKRVGRDLPLGAALGTRRRSTHRVGLRRGEHGRRDARVGRGRLARRA